MLSPLPGTLFTLPQPLLSPRGHPQRRVAKTSHPWAGAPVLATSSLFTPIPAGLSSPREQGGVCLIHSVLRTPCVSSGTNTIGTEHFSVNSERNKQVQRCDKWKPLASGCWGAAKAADTSPDTPTFWHSCFNSETVCQAL